MGQTLHLNPAGTTSAFCLDLASTSCYTGKAGAPWTHYHRDFPPHTQAVNGNWRRTKGSSFSKKKKKPSLQNAARNSVSREFVRNAFYRDTHHSQAAINSYFK